MPAALKVVCPSAGSRSYMRRLESITPHVLSPFPLMWAIGPHTDLNKPLHVYIHRSLVGRCNSNRLPLLQSHVGHWAPHCYYIPPTLNISLSLSLHSLPFPFSPGKQSQTFGSPLNRYEKQRLDFRSASHSFLLFPPPKHISLCPVSLSLCYKVALNISFHSFNSPRYHARRNGRLHSINWLLLLNHQTSTWLPRQGNFSSHLSQYKSSRNPSSDSLI